jgi:undecaprenyl phosphate-alpha-L-ara4N flippase subunit ArnE
MQVHAIVFISMAIGLEVLGQTSFKLGTLSVTADSGPQSALNYLRRIFRSTWIRVGILAYAFEILCGVTALTLAPLNIVFPLLSLSYCGVALAGRVFLGETLAPRSLAGVALITIGATMVSWSSAR